MHINELKDELKIEELKNQDLELHLKVTIANNKITDKIKKDLENLATKVKLPGFRSGKVPLSIVHKKYHASVKGEVLEHFISDAVSKIIKLKQLRLASEACVSDVKFADQNDLDFVIEFELSPNIELPDFAQITLEKPILKITLDELDATLNLFLKKHTVFSKEKTKPSKINDQVIIDSIGYIDGKEFANGKLENYALVLGTKSLIPGFEDQLIGVKAGDNVSVKVVFPDNYHAKELQSKSAVFETKVQKVYEPNVPTLDDAFAQTLNFKTVEELKKHIEDDVVRSYAYEVFMLLKMKLFNDLEERLSFNVPPSAMMKEVNILKGKFEEMASDESDQSEMDENNTKLTDDECNRLALRRVRIGLVINEYAKVYNISITSDDIKNSLLSYAMNYRIDPKYLMQAIQKDKSLLRTFNSDALEQKVVTHILDNKVKTNIKEYSKADLDKILNSTFE